MSIKSDKDNLLRYLRHEKEMADRKARRNKGDGFPDAADGWKKASDDFGRWIALAESL